MTKFIRINQSYNPIFSFLVLLQGQNPKIFACGALAFCLYICITIRISMNAELEHLLLLYFRSHQILSLQGQNPKIFACGALTFRLYICITIRISMNAELEHLIPTTSSQEPPNLVVSGSKS